MDRPDLAFAAPTLSPDVGRATARAARCRYLRPALRDALSQFRHPHFWIFLSAHFRIARSFVRSGRLVLKIDLLHKEVKLRIADMNTGLDAGSRHRQANTALRLTAVRILDLNMNGMSVCDNTRELAAIGRHSKG